MSYKQRDTNAKKAEKAVVDYFEKAGWTISRLQLRNSLSDKHNNLLSLQRKNDIYSLFVRHFPDHIATKNITILIQTKYAQQGYSCFVIEKQCIDTMKLLPEPKLVYIIWWTEKIKQFSYLSLEDLVKITDELVPNTGHSGSGSGTPYYMVDKKLTKILNIN